MVDVLGSTAYSFLAGLVATASGIGGGSFLVPFLVIGLMMIIRGLTGSSPLF